MVVTENGNLVDVFTIHILEFSREISTSEILTRRLHKLSVIQSRQLKIASNVLTSANAVVCFIIVPCLMFFSTSRQSLLGFQISYMSKKLKETELKIKKLFLQMCLGMFKSRHFNFGKSLTTSDKGSAVGALLPIPLRIRQEPG